MTKRRPFDQAACLGQSIEVVVKDSIIIEDSGVICPEKPLAAEGLITYIIPH
jgi:hypothetical protein